MGPAEPEPSPRGREIPVTPLPRTYRGTSDLSVILPRLVSPRLAASLFSSPENRHHRSPHNRWEEKEQLSTPMQKCQRLFTPESRISERCNTKHSKDQQQSEENNRPGYAALQRFRLRK
ncbi:hypothetical protein KOW79_001958 [Hemibagrus wyckioides]|uniref:Uncharacterized protein n=1 Tax=Hemibagrus wyckioides TaxID=337641 RepID=A0A9D3SST2_9TELE|nr:hypothetical protein KOW79_001958 [Hemibagrus wyckioides]